MSPEKRLLPFLEALAESGIGADVEVIGGGGQLRAARRLVEKLRPGASVVFAGRMPYAETLRRIAAADAVVQTSIGFETQGMTLFEAASLGTPSIVSDPDIAARARLRAMGCRGRVGRRRSPRPCAAPRPTSRPAARRAGPVGRERFRQSSRTAAMIEVYQRVTG